MRTSSWWAIGAALTLSVGAAAQPPRADPESILTSRFGFTSAEIAKARQGQPVVRVKAGSEELVAGGAIKLSGRKERLADWLKNIEHFRNAAELGITHVIPSPPAAAAFAGVNLDANDLVELRQCGSGKCAIRLSADALGRLQRDVAWDTPQAAAQANDIVRQMLLGYTTGYVQGGHAGLGAYDGPQARPSFADEMRTLIREATALTDLAPELVAYLEGYPSATLPGADQLFYWSSVTAGSDAILSLHHLVVYRRGTNEVWVADKSLYASRFIDAGLLAIGLYDAPDGSGYYAIAGTRVRASRLGGVAGTVLRRQVQRSASDTVKMYLEWMRDSLAQGL